jgi:hypothetical protein
MEGLNKNGKGYCVVRMNSTTGKYIVERTSENQLRQSCADIAGIWTTKKEALQQMKQIND